MRGRAGMGGVGERRPTGAQGGARGRGKREVTLGSGIDVQKSQVDWVGGLNQITGRRQANTRTINL